MIKQLMVSCLLIFTAFLSYGQSNQIFQQNTNLRLENSSEQKVSTFEINGKYKQLMIGLNYILNSGKFKMEVYKPNGILDEYTFNVDAEGTLDFPFQHNLSQDDSLATEVADLLEEGNVLVCLKRPKEGLWKIRITPEKADGLITIITKAGNKF